MTSPSTSEPMSLSPQPNHEMSPNTSPLPISEEDHLEPFSELQTWESRVSLLLKDMAPNDDAPVDDSWMNEVVDDEDDEEWLKRMPQGDMECGVTAKSGGQEAENTVRLSLFSRPTTSRSAGMAPSKYMNGGPSRPSGETYLSDFNKSKGSGGLHNIPFMHRVFRQGYTVVNPPSPVPPTASKKHRTPFFLRPTPLTLAFGIILLILVFQNLFLLPSTSISSDTMDEPLPPSPPQPTIPDILPIQLNLTAIPDIINPPLQKAMDWASHIHLPFPASDPISKPSPMDDKSKSTNLMDDEKKDMEADIDMPSHRVLLNPTLSVFTPQTPHKSHYHIPRKIHITVPNKYLLDATLTQTLNQWRTLNPTFTVNIYNDDDMRRLVESVGEEFPGALEVFDGFERMVEKADFWRYLVVYVEGGVYVDSDVVPLRPVEEWTGAFDGRVLGRGVGRGYAAGGEGKVVGWEAGNVFPRHDDDSGSVLQETPTDTLIRDDLIRDESNTTMIVDTIEAPLIQGLIGMEGFVSSERARISNAFAAQVQFCQWAFAFRRHHPFLRSLLYQIIEEVKKERTVTHTVKNVEGWRMEVLQRTGPGAFSRGVEKWMKTNEGVWEEEEEGKGWMDWIKKKKQKKTTTRNIVSTRELVYRYEVVGTVGFMPIWAFSDTPLFNVEAQVPEWEKEAAKRSDDKVLVKHLFRGTWKDDGGVDGWISGADDGARRENLEGMRSAFGIDVSEELLREIMNGTLPGEEIPGREEDG